MKSCIYTILTTLTILLYSCGHVDAETNLQQAESYLQSGRLDMAASSCDMLADTTLAEPLTSTQMLRIALIYAKLSEMSDNQDYMASATQCYERAITLDENVKAIDGYLMTLDEENQSIARVIRELSDAMNATYEYIDEQDDDVDSYTEEIIQLSDPSTDTAAI